MSADPPDPDAAAELDAAPETRGPDVVAATTGASVVGAGLWHMAAKVLPQLYVLAISVTAARILGPAGMGQQSFISFVQVSVVLLLTGGFSAALMRHTAEVVGRGSPDVARGLLRWAWRLLGVGAVGGVAILVAMGLFRAELRSAWMLAAVAGGMAVLHAVPHSVLTGLQRWREASIVSLVTGALGAGGTLAVLQAGGGIPGMFAVEAVVTAINLVWTTVLVRRSVTRLTTTTTMPDATLRRRVRVYAGGAWLQLVLHLVVWKRSELFVLDWTSTDTEIAMYSVAFATLGAARQIPHALASTLAPAIATLYGAGAMERIARGLGRGVRLLVIASLPLAAGLLALGPLLLRVVFGEDYAPAGPVLQLMAVVLPILPLSAMCSGVLHGLDRIRSILLASVVATVVNVVLALTLIPAHGAIGAAIANGGAQLTAVVFMLRAALAALPDVSLRLRALLPALVATVLCGFTAFAIGQTLGGAFGLVLGSALGAVVFLGSAGVLRILDEEDARWIDEALGARVGGRVGRVARAWGGIASHDAPGGDPTNG
jgi:O-antigen/teichoic acid export membrane protein